MKTYSHSGKVGARLATGKGSRRLRIETALRGIMRKNVAFSVEPTGQNSSSIAHFPKRDLEILVSYQIAVAFRDGGRTFCTPYGEFSRTTDKAIRNFVPGNRDCVRLSVSEFNSALSGALGGNG
jgi:hypothetical protein